MGDNRFKCKICDKTFSRKYCLNEHLKIHLGLRPFKCDHCGKTFTKKFSLSLHLRRVHGHQKIHSDIKSYHQCDQCGKSFLRKFYLLLHIKNVHLQASCVLQKKKNECALCSKVFSSRHSLWKHMCSHNDKLFKCETCQKHFTLQRSLNKHMNIHLGEKPFQCELCDKSFSRKNSLNEHIKTHLGPRPFKCDQCDKTFTKRFSLSVHIKGVHGSRIKKTYKCTLCTKVLTSEYYYKVHMAEHDKKRLFKCEICGKCFILKCTLNGHMNSHYGEKKYQCDYCGKTFARKFYLSFHIKTFHTHDSCIRHKCHECNKQFNTKYHLKMHKKRHTKSECLICFQPVGGCDCSLKLVGEKYDRLKNRLAQEDLMIRCQICFKPLLRMFQLRMHSRMHREFRCILCNEDYKDCICCNDMEVSKAGNTYRNTNKSSTSVDKSLEEKVTEPALIELNETIMIKDDDCTEDYKDSRMKLTKNVRTYQRTSKRSTDADKTLTMKPVESVVKYEKESMELHETTMIKDDDCMDYTEDCMILTKSVKTYQKTSKSSTNADKALTVKPIEPVVTVKLEEDENDEKNIDLSEIMVLKKEPKEECFEIDKTSIDVDAFNIKQESTELYQII